MGTTNNNSRKSVLLDHNKLAGASEDHISSSMLGSRVGEDGSGVRNVYCNLAKDSSNS